MIPGIMGALYPHRQRRVDVHGADARSVRAAAERASAAATRAWRRTSTRGLVSFIAAALHRSLTVVPIP
jgi:hypothetical protein